MRTGLITFHFAHHYGAQLQALATMRAIQSLGHDCEIIDYRLPHTTRTNQLFKKSGGVRGMASDAHTALHYGAFQRRFRRFEAFVAEEMALSPRRYTAFEQLRADPPAYDVYVAGSDQIWNPYIFQDKQFDPSFLLGFVREGRRIAYAPSLGVPELPEDKAEELRRFLTPFSALSVREKRGQVLLREAAGRDARVVLDPTLLLTGEDWGELAAAPKRQGPYILCYFVSDPGEAAPYALALSARTGWPIVQLAGARRKIDGAAELVFDAGPREFLGLFRHASAVVTNSFHGAAFSLQFQKDFFTSMSPRERAEPTFSRIYSLLSRLGCADRILGLDTTAPVDAPIDYGAVYEKLAAARADSLSYLGAAIEGAPLPAEEPEPQAAPRPVLCRAEDCTGCTACVQSVLGGRGGKCVLKDDFDWLLDKMLDADGIVFSTPIFEKGATGLFHTITDRFGPRMDRGNNIIGTKIAEETGGTAPDPRILKDKVISFMSVGGSDWVTRTQCDAGMLALTPMWKVIDNEVFPWALSILVEDERVARAHQIGRNIAEAAKNIEHAQYQGDAGVCPHCHSRNFHLQDGKAICCLCGLEGEIHNESGKYSFTFPAEQLEHAHDTLSGKFIHGNDIKENTGKKIANMQTEKYKARQAAYRAFITATVPEKG